MLRHLGFLSVFLSLNLAFTPIAFADEESVSVLADHGDCPSGHEYCTCIKYWTSTSCS